MGITPFAVVAEYSAFLHCNLQDFEFEVTNNNYLYEPGQNLLGL
jgi:hypothetical protein